MGGNSKGQLGKKPKFAGLDERDFGTNETNVPHTYFAGVRNLAVSWMMQLIITKASNPGGGKTKGIDPLHEATWGQLFKHPGKESFFGHLAGVICQGQLDFIWGVTRNNDLIWPIAKLWDTHIYPAGRVVIYTGGDAYQASAKTLVQPPAFPWVLFATLWTAIAYNIGQQVVYNGNVWKSIANANSHVPPSAAPAPLLHVQAQTPVDNWIYICTPDVWTAGTSHWAIHSVVAWKGRLWTNSAATNNEPPAAPWSAWKQDRAANPLKFTVAHIGDHYIYWGTANQTLDAGDEQILTSLGHPPYRNKAVLVMKNCLLGGTPTSQTDYHVLGGRNPVQTLIGGAAAALDADWNANPWCVTAEILTHPAIGLGLPDAWFDATTWQAEADRCYVNPGLYYISPMITSLKRVREIVADLLSYPDAFIFWSTVATLMAGHWPHGEAAPAFDGTNTINRNNLTEPIKTKSDGWGATSNSAQVSFEDIQAGFKSRPLFATNLFNKAVVKRLQTLTVDRPHIVRASQASAWAAEIAKINGDQSLAGELSKQAEKAAAVIPGAIFLLTDDALGTSQPMRCTGKVISAPPQGTEKITFESERGVSPQPYSPTLSNPTPEQGPAPAPLLNFAAVQLPSALGNGPSSLAILAGRSSEFTSQFEIWFRQADNASFQQIGAAHGFAVMGTLEYTANSEVIEAGGDTAITQSLGAVVNGNTYALTESDFWQNQVSYSAFVGMFPFTMGIEGVDYVIDPVAKTITIVAGGGIATGQYVRVKVHTGVIVIYDPATPQSDLDSVSEALTADQIDNGEIMLFVLQAANPALFEIMSVKSVVVAAAGKLLLRVRRAVFGSLIGGDGSYDPGTDGNDVAVIVRRSAIVPLTHNSFPSFQAAGATIPIRLLPSSAWVEAEISDLYDPATNPSGLTTGFDYTWNNIYAPTVLWGSLQKNGADISDFTISFASTDVFNFSFEVNDRNGDLVHAALVAVQGQQERTLWASNFTPSSKQNKTVEFLLPKGLWTIELRGLDAAGNQSSIPLSSGGNLVTMYIDNGTAAAPIVAGYNKLNGYICQLLFGYLPAGLTVKYQLQNRNVAFSGGSWVTAAAWNVPGTLYGPVPNYKGGWSGKTLYAYVHETGKTDSAILHWNL